MGSGSSTLRAASGDPNGRWVKRCLKTIGMMHRLRRPASGVFGSALIPTIGATAALAVVVMLLLTASLTAYESAAYRVEAEQADRLAEAALLRVQRELGLGLLRPPRTDMPIVLDTYLDLPPLPSGFRPWPPRSPAFVSGQGRTELGFGVWVLLSVVVGPDNNARLLQRQPDPDAILFDAVAEAWYRRATARRTARFASTSPLGPIRLP